MTVEKKKILWAVSHLGERETPFVRRMEEAGFEVIRNPLGRLYKEEELTETASATPQEVVEVPLSVSGRTRKQRWARLIKQVYEAVPLPCPRCGRGMRILAFIEPACADTADRQPEVIDLPVPGTADREDPHPSPCLCRGQTGLPVPRADRGLWPARAHSPPAGYPLPFSLQRVVAA